MEYKLGEAWAPELLEHQVSHTQVSLVHHCDMWWRRFVKRVWFSTKGQQRTKWSPSQGVAAGEVTFSVGKWSGFLSRYFNILSTNSISALTSVSWRTLESTSSSYIEITYSCSVVRSWKAFLSNLHLKVLIILHPNAKISIWLA